MEPHAFIAEVYRRMSLRQSPNREVPDWEEIRKAPTVVRTLEELQPLLPSDKSSAILDIGFGNGWFIAACISLGYTSISGADFGIVNKEHVQQWSASVVGLHEIRSNIGEFLAGKEERYDFIHLSHVIEHIPKYSLLYVVDALYAALRKGGTLLLRTPNMEGPCANSSYYVTLAHEYGFTGANLSSLLSICNFNEIQFHQLSGSQRSFKQLAGELLRWPILKWNAARHRLFGVNYGGQFGAELVVTAKRGDLPAFFDPRYR
jgi:2-polyprenyl-3-methyl-5-hydroxy-6-metoxy-1,4-benzoquinol methylase